MNSKDSVLRHLQNQGERITAVRRELIGVLLESRGPLSVQDILKKLKRGRAPVNKTTVYRQLETLQKYNLIREVRFADRTVRYELAAEGDHHHHLVCLRCKKIEEMDFPHDVARQEKAIWSKKKFKVLRHSLEFFGACRGCQKK